MSKSLVGETENAAVSQYEVTKARREVETKHVNAGQQIVDATESSQRDGGRREVINRGHPVENQSPLSQSSPTKAAYGELPTEPFYLSKNGVYVPPRNGRYLRIASLLAGFSISRLPYRFPRLHGLFLELCSFRHRIQLVWRRGGTCFLETGPVYQQTSLQSHPVLNRQTQLRTQGIQRLLSEYPWLSGEDCNLFLMGWNKGWKSCETLGTANSSGDM